MGLNKMGQFVTNKVLNGEWHGMQSQAWLELETNTLCKTYSQKQIALAPSEDVSVYSFLSTLYFENAMNILQMQNDEIAFVDKQIDPTSNFLVNISIGKLPNYDRKIHVSMEVGVAFYDQNGGQYETLSLSNRCHVYRNDVSLESLSIANFKMMDDGSQIIVNCNEGKIMFQHLNSNGIMYKNNEKIIEFDVKRCSFLKIYVHQYHGNGVYRIYEAFDKNNGVMEEETTKRRRKKKPKIKKKKLSKDIITKKQLMKLAKPKLIKQCKKYKVSPSGSKSEMADRILMQISQ